MTGQTSLSTHWISPIPTHRTTIFISFYHT